MNIFRIKLLSVLLIPTFFMAQFNTTELGYLDLVTMHNSDANDVWGWANGTGNEYAIVGLNNGVSVVDVTDPTNPTEVFFESGMNSIWRDIKTYNGYAYITTEAQNGLLIIDMNTLPANANLATNYYTGPSGNEWQSAHNIFIDSNGVAYIFGANRGNGGTIMLDITTDPMNPVEIGIEDTYYVHDGVVRNDTLFQACINDGFFTIHDVSDKSNPVFLGIHNTPGNFAHNIWFSDDGEYVYTTDEISNGFIGEYNITDFSAITQTDEIQSSPGMNVIPHNAHYIDDYLVTSYYRDGVVIHDVSNKGNMIEVGNFDTSPNFNGDGFNGCWGAYPWLPSGNIISSDIEEGLHVIGVTYQRACYLEGTVTELGSGTAINQANIEIVSSTIIDQSDVVGEYETGIATSGNYDIIYSHPSYVSDTVFGVVLANGVVTIQDVQLTAVVPVIATVVVTDVATSADLENVEILLFNDDFSFSGQTDANGTFVINNIVPGGYNLVIGEWGYQTTCQYVMLNTTQTYTIDLTKGYYDDFSFNYLWISSGAAPDGVWERGDPNGTMTSGMQVNPEDDFGGDCMEKAYVTGNSVTSSIGADDVDFADAVLTSPVMDLSDYLSPKVTCKIWWQNFGGSGTPNDSLNVYVTDGATEELVATFLSADSDDSWQDLSFHIDHFLTPNATMKVIFKTADWQANGGHIVEAGVDVFMVEESTGVGVNEVDAKRLEVSVYPNPSNGIVNATVSEDSKYQLTDINGKLVVEGVLSKGANRLKISNKGVFFLNVISDSKVETFKVVVL